MSETDTIESAQSRCKKTLICSPLKATTIGQLQ